MALKVHTINITLYEIHIKNIKKEMVRLEKNPCFVLPETKEAKPSLLKPIFCGSFFLGSESSI